MRYMGGKTRIAAPIAKIISTAGGDTFVSLFCGACSVESKLTGFNRIILNDKHKYLIAMLRGVQAGYELPDKVTEQQYKEIRADKDRDPVLTGFAGFVCSFGGKFFGGYARDKKYGRNYAEVGKRGLLKTMSTLQKAEILCKDYRDVPIPSGAVIYADPPYKDATPYGSDKFNYEDFWAYMRLLSEKGHKVYISEQNAPPDFICVWQKPIRRTIDVNKNNNFLITEKLFTKGF